MSEDSMRCRRAPELTFETSKDDRRYRGAYHLLHSHMAMLIASGHLTRLPKAEAEALLDSVEAELHPPEFEVVEESAGWVNIYPANVPSDTVKSNVTHAYPTEATANANAASNRIGCQELRVKVKRPVKRPVVREVEEKGVELQQGGGIYTWENRPCSIFAGTAAAGKTVTLIARWTE